MSERVPRLIWNPEVAVLAALSAATHFWRLLVPAAVVFDERHYERFAGHYLAGTYYVDVHPPLGKLLYAAEARLFDVPAATLLAAQPAPILRLLPALCGALVVPLVYVILRLVGGTRRAATLGAALLLFENAVLVDSRFVLLEPLLITFGLMAVAAFLLARLRRGITREVLIALAALFGGLAVSVKWTGLSALGVIGVAWLYDLWTQPKALRRAVVEGSMLVLIPVAVYCGMFAIHFALLEHAGVDGAFMSSRFRETLIGDPLYRPNARMGFFGKLSDLHRAMNVGNATLDGVAHPAASPWYTWPVMKHPINFWETDGPPKQNVMLLGNPVVWWGSLIAGLLLAVQAVRGRVPRDRRRWALAFIGGGFLINYVPFIAITRVMYLYHYLFALIWLVMLAALSTDAFSEPAEADLLLPAKGRDRLVVAGCAALVLIGFVYFLPFTYGFPLSAGAYDARFWVLHPHF